MTYHHNYTDSPIINYIYIYTYIIVFTAGYNPRKPDLLNTDTLPPVLQRWYLYRNNAPSSSSSISAMMFFDEPIHLLNLSHIMIHYCEMNQRQRIINTIGQPYPLQINNDILQTSATVSYTSYQRIVTLRLTNYCQYISSSSSSSSYTTECMNNHHLDLYSFLNQPIGNNLAYFLTISSSDSVEDFASVPNNMRIIRLNSAIIEGEPGNNYDVDEDNDDDDDDYDDDNDDDDNDDDHDDSFDDNIDNDNNDDNDDYYVMIMTMIMMAENY